MAPRAFLLALLLTLAPLAGCLGGTDSPPPTNIGDGGTGAGGDGNGGSGGGGDDPLLDGKHLSATLQATSLSEGDRALLLLRNNGTATLSGFLALELRRPDGAAIARVTSSSAVDALLPRGTIQFAMDLPAKLEGGTYTLVATLDGATATVTTPIGGSAAPGEGPFPLGFTPIYDFRVTVDRLTYFRTEAVLVTLHNDGNVPVRGVVNVSVHGPAGTTPSGSTHTAPQVDGRDYADLTIEPGANATLAPFAVPLATLPTSLAQYYVFVAWKHGTAVANFYIDNRTAKPAADYAPVQRAWDPAPTVAGWTGKTDFTIHNGTNRMATLHYALPGEPGPQSDAAYRTKIISSLQAAWTYYVARGYQVPDPTMPIHVFIDHPGGSALGTMQPTAYGAHVVIGPESLHTQKTADVRTTSAHELFHVFQVGYDFHEGFILEGVATWIMDLPFAGSKEFIGQSRAYISEPDGKPFHYLEHEFALFVHWLANKPAYGGGGPEYTKMRQLTELSRDYDNEHLLQVVFGKSLDALFVEFVTDIANRSVAAPHTETLFDTPGVFALRAWEWYYNGTAGNLTNEKAARQLKLGFSGFEDRKAELIDEDVGQVRHAYGFDVYNVTADLGLQPSSDNVKITFTSRDAATSFTVLLATQTFGGGWAVETLPAEGRVVENLREKNAYVYVLRTEAGNGRFDISLAPSA